jgi:hypothetical protein
MPDEKYALFTEWAIDRIINRAADLGISFTDEEIQQMTESLQARVFESINKILSDKLKDKFGEEWPQT